jgi:uncharacterized membrane protein YphA (DoxX/SURF4 family)
VSPVRSVISWATDRPGSTRIASLLRIGLALLLWSRWASPHLPFRDLSPERLAIGAIFFASTTLMLVGLWSRISTFVAGCTAMGFVYYLGWYRGFEPYQHHHTTFLAMCVFLLAFTPCGGSYSVDRWRRVRRAERAGQQLPPETGNNYALRLIAFQLAAVYFWSALQKCNIAFLSGVRLQQVFMYYYVGSDAPAPVWFEPLCIAVAIGTLAIEFTLTFGLWFRRLQRPLIIAGIGFHLGIYYFVPVSTFSLTSILVYLAFLDPDQVHRIIDRMSGGRTLVEE